MVVGGATLGADAIPGDPTALASAGSQLRRVASEVDAIHARISANGLHGSWSGSAANQFRSSLHELPRELAKLTQSFATAGDAVNTFASRLAELQSHAQWFAGHIDEATAQLHDANARHDSASSMLASARRAHAAAGDPVSQHAALRAIGSATSAVAAASATRDDLVRRIATLRSEANQNHDSYEAAAASCARSLEDASLLGIRNSFGSLVRHQLDQMAPLLLGNPLLGPLAAVYELDTHWGESRRWLDIASNVLGGLTVVAAATGAEPVALFFGAASILMGGLVLQGDAVAAVEGDRTSRDHLVGDGVDLGLSLIGIKELKLAAGAEKEVARFAPQVLPPLRRVARQEMAAAQRQLKRISELPFVRKVGSEAEKVPVAVAKSAAEYATQERDAFLSDNANNVANHRPVLSVPIADTPFEVQIPLVPSLQPTGVP